MTAVLDRDALESSPLADLHLIANEIGVDGFRRLRKADLVDAILSRQTGYGAAADAADAAAPAGGAAKAEAQREEAPRRRARRSRARKAAEDETVAAVEAADQAD